ncbi:MAG: RNA polymerase sigma factor [Sciscionella sp.]
MSHIGPAAAGAAAPVHTRDHDRGLHDDWVIRLSMTGRVHDRAVDELHALMLRAARHQLGRMPDVAGIGAMRREEIVQSAADEATVSVLSRLDTFEGRSRFTTWAYKFGIIHTLVEARRAAWSGREIPLHELDQPRQPLTASPEAYAEGTDLSRAVREGMDQVLTPHQRRVAEAVLVDEVPIDVLAERLSTTRSAIYKTIHDARKRLRTHLAAHDYLPTEGTEQVNR